MIEALADGPVAMRELWRVLLDMDWKATLKAFLLPIDHPLQHQLVYPRRMRMRIGDGLWVRLVDVGAALSARAYGGDGPVVLEVEDPFLPENAGRWRIAGGKAERTEAEPDLALDVGELGSAYLGGFTFAELVRAGVVEELKDGGAARADVVFLTARRSPGVRDLLTRPCYPAPLIVAAIPRRARRAPRQPDPRLTCKPLSPTRRWTLISSISSP